MRAVFVIQTLNHKSSRQTLPLPSPHATLFNAFQTESLFWRVIKNKSITMRNLQ